MINTEFKLLNFEKHGDEDGWLVSLESMKNIDLDIKRVFYIFDTKPNVTRGKHALKRGKQLLISVSGSCKVLVDNVEKREVFELNNCQKGLLIDGMVWREMFDFTPDCVLLVLSDTYYNTKDYIHSYEELKKVILGNK